MANQKEYLKEYYKTHKQDWKNLKYKNHQIGTSIKSIDEKRKALLPGKRMSKTGHIYYEYRRSRSDERGKSV